jgi:multiple sugar transport system ATP-binding protein
LAAIEFRGVTKRFPDGTVAVDELDLRIEDGEFMIFVGPSGCGKTTALRMVAGLERPTAGEIVIGDTVVNDLDPVDRDIAMVFQNYALYPHMTVRQNIDFPLETQKVPKAEREKRVADAAALLGLEHLLDRKPRQLSGGQRQRVAMGRAIVRHPRSFLMDEPLSNLDAKLRVQMRAELVKLHQRLGVTTLYVTHDQVEAMTLGQRVAVMSHGVVQQVDAPDVLYNAPANTFVASFIGSPAMNFLRARSDGSSLELGPHRLPLPATVTRRIARSKGDLLVGLRPEHFGVAAGEAGDTIPATVEITEQLGSETLVYFHIEGVQAEAIGGEADADLGSAFVARLDPRLHPAPGQTVRVAVDLDRAHFFDPADGTSLQLAA